MQLPYATSSGQKSADAQVVALECSIVSILLLPDGTNACTLNVYDGTSTSGLKIASLSIAALAVAPQVLTFQIPVKCNAGIYADVAGTGATYIIHYIA